MDFTSTERLQHSDSAAAGAQVDTYLGPVDNWYEVVEVRQIHAVAGGASAAVDVVKCASGTLPSAGVSVLLTSFDLTATAGVPRTRTKSANTLSATAARRQLAPGDSLALNYSGTLTGLLGVAVQVILKPLRRKSV